MRVGDTSGKKKVYKKDGSPKFDKGEKILGKYIDNCSVSLKKKGKRLATMVLDTGKGDIYLTNKRFIHIRTPSTRSRTSSRGLHLFGVVYGLFDLIMTREEVKDLKQRNVYEYVEFKYGEISEIKRGLFAGTVSVNAKAGEYSVFLRKRILEKLRAAKEREERKEKKEKKKKKK